VISGATSTLPGLPSSPVDSKNQVASRNRPATAPFSFADTPRLTAALRAGDEDAFRWLHEQWNMRLFRYCFVLAHGDGTLAGEIAQAAYIRLFRHIRELPDEIALWNWLARAARNAASDLHRTGGRYQGAMARFTEWFRLNRLAAGPEIQNDDDLLASLERALASLKEEELALIEARYAGHTSLEVIGDHLGISARAVEGRLARLRTKIRQLMTAELQKSKSRPE
jgi:RNA polymerase sigma factor (sigma-70 family)